MSAFEIARWKKVAVIEGILFFGLLAITARQATDPDLWWHLRTGQWMVENRQIPHADPFSFSRGGAPWISHEWLSELLFFEIFHLSGFAGLIVFSSIVTTAGFMLLYRRCAAPPHWAAAITVLGALASAPTWGVRPQMFTFTLGSFWLWLLDRSEERPWLLAWLPPLFLVWLNLHAGYALGPAVLFAYGIGLIWEAMAGQAEWRSVRPQALRLLLTIAICLALVPLNPSGSQLYKYPLKTLASGNMRSFISEWHSPDFHHPSYLPALLLVLGCLLVFALCPSRPRPRIILPLLGAFVAALDAVRHIPIFVLFAVPVIATIKFPASSAALPGRSSTTRLKGAAAGAVLMLMSVFAATEWIELARSQRASEARIYPVNAVEQLASLGACGRVFSFYGWGGYVIWKLYPASKVFVDGRADLYVADVLYQYRKVMELRPDWRQILQSWHVTAVLVPSSSALAQGLALDPLWRVQYQDARSSLFVQDISPSRTPEMKTISTELVVGRPQNLSKK